MAQVILSDENCVGHAIAIFHALSRLEEGITVCVIPRSSRS